MSFRRSWIALLGVLAGCSTNPSPRVTSVSPSTVTSLAATSIAIGGSHFFNDPSASVDDGSARVDRAWQVRIGATAIDPASVQWVDTATLHAVVPAGLAAGVYDVTVIAPDHRSSTLAGGLTVSDQPVGLTISIEDAPGGTGMPVGAKALAAGDVLALYAVLRDPAGTYVTDQLPVDWSASGGIGILDATGPAVSASLQATTVGVGDVSATDPSAAAGSTGPLTVSAGAAQAISVESAPGGTGTHVDGQSLTTDDTMTLYAVARDAFGNFAGDVAATWSVTSAIGAFGTGPTASSTVLDLTRPGVGVATAALSPLVSGASGDLSVSPGRAAALTVAPPTLTLSADDAPAAFSAAGTDADGNATADLGALSWSIASGPITMIGAATGTLDPKAAGVGTVRVTSSYGPHGDSGAITIVPGLAAALTVTPPMLAVTADAAPVTFTVSGTDADGNPTSSLGSIGWSIASGAVTAIDAVTGIFAPTAAGSGIVRATSSIGIHADANPVTVTPGRAATLTLSPPSLTISADAPPTAFILTATDAKGNPTTDLGTISWSVSSGPISSIDGAGVFDPVTSGSGSVRAASSYGPTAQSAVTVTPGRAVSLAVSPATLATSVGSPATPFSTVGTDADGNATSDVGTLAWSVSSGALSSLDAVTGTFTPMVVGTGAFRASSSYGLTADSGLVSVTSTLDTAPLACFGGTTSGGSLLGAFSFDASCSSDAEDATASLQVRWDYEGDGAWDTGFSTTKTTSHGYTLAAGIYSPTVEVRDTKGRTSIASHRVLVYGALLADVTVNTAVDENNPGASPLLPGGTGFSLREAINYVNGSGGSTAIHFSGPMTINATLGVMPALTASGSVIVGQPGVVVDFGNAGAPSGTCFQLAGSNEELMWVTLRGCGGAATLRLAGSGNRVSEGAILLGAGTGTSGIRLSGTNQTAGPNVEVSGFDLGASSYGVYDDVDPSPGTFTVDGVRSHGNRVGIFGGGFSGLVVQRSWVYSNGSDGIRLANGESAAVLRDDVIDGNGGDGIHVGNTVNQTVRNDLITNNGGFGLSAACGSMDPDGWYANGAGAIGGSAPGPGSTTANVFYVNAASADFRLEPYSPAVNKGVDLGLDLNGPDAGRFNGSAPDFGATESPY